MKNDNDAGKAVRPPRPRGVPAVGEVRAVENLSPHLVRIHLGGPGVEALIAAADPVKLASTDKYVKMLFASPAAPLEPPYDLDSLRELLPPEQLPVRRTYTVRSVDASSGTLAIDFVVHGDEGVAGPWAANAQLGDRVSLSGPGGGFAPSKGEIDRLVLGDESAIPAIAAALEALPEGARGLALIEVGDAVDELNLVRPAGIELRWLHRSTAGVGHGEALATAVEGLDPVAGPIEVFAHGERGAIKRIRVALTDAWNVPRSSMSISAYWAAGRAEDAFQAEKRTPAGEIFAPGQ